MLDETTILIVDLEDVRTVLAACQNFFQAEDIQRAQLAYTETRYSPLTNEIARVKTRMDGVLSDHLLRLHEETADDAESDEGEETAEDTSQELPAPENGSESVTEASEELSEHPLGEFKPPRQTGRRVSAKRQPGAAATDG